MSSIAPEGVQIGFADGRRESRFRSVADLREALENALEAQAQQFALWIPVLFGLGIACWFVLPSEGQWVAALLAFAMCAAGGVALGGRAGRLLLWAGLLAAAGMALVWTRAEMVAAPRLERPVTTVVSGRVERVERLAGRGIGRVMLVDSRSHPGLRVRVSARMDQIAKVQSGALVEIHARLMPPAPPVIPGGYDFARAAWFKGIGATGRALGAPAILAPAAETEGFWLWLDRLRGKLTQHLQNRIGGGEGGIAAALVTGDQGGVPDDVAQALRDSGLAHLLSISGLHVAAAVGFAMLATRRLLALSVYAATYWPLTLIAAGVGAGAGVAYSLLAGGEVPTVRSCIAALLVLLGLALGRDAITLRVVAAGAFIILLFRPEALVGPSFQLSFAAVIAIVALHELPWLRQRLAKREEPWWAGSGRSLIGLLLTGLVVEAALAPIGLFHFNRMGVYGAFANIIAIPLTTFVIMPLEAIALLLDPLGIAAPFYWLLKGTLAGLIGLATHVAALPGGVALSPTMPRIAFGLMLLGGLWLALWRGRIRLAGLLPIALGAGLAMLAPAADVLVTGDGRHAAVLGRDGQVHMLRAHAGDYVREVMMDASAATLAEPLDNSPIARCGPDACVADIWKDGRRLRLLATRSPVFIDRALFEPACRSADIVISDRRLPQWCMPQWLKADRALLARTGGLTIHAGSGRVRTVAEDGGDHPWSAFSDHGYVDRQPLNRVVVKRRAQPLAAAAQ